MKRSLVPTALLVGAALLASPRASAETPLAPPSPSPSPSAQEEARARFARGVELYQEGDFKLASIEFERAYATAPSYRMLYDIGEVELQLGHYAKALRALERYLAEGGDRIPAQRRADVQSDLTAVRGRTATLTVHASVPGAAVELDQAPLGTSHDEAVTVDAGEHRVRVTKRGFEPAEQTLVLAGGDVKVVDVTLTAERPMVTRVAAPARPEAWIAWGTTAVLTASAVVCGAMALKSTSDLHDARATIGTSAADRQDLADRAHTFALATDVLAGGAVVAAAAAVFFTVRKPTTGAAPRTGLGIGPGSLVLAGTF